MIEIDSKYDCCGCHACATVCPKDCIRMVADAEGFDYPEVEVEKCINCNLCQKVCPVILKKEANEVNKNEPIALAAINKDDEVRLNSSSGGIFSLLSEAVINNNGVVFGAALSDDCKSVGHVCIQTKEELDALRGSKYVQSKIGNAYNETKTILQSGKIVLFSGTPCQISGLYAFLNNDYDNLFTCDFVCHGVPSPLVWKKYVELREEKAASKTQRIFFRHKKNGWKTYSVQFQYQNCTEYIQIVKNDLYMRGFLTNLYLRPSCYSCKFKGVNRSADITLADFWGIEKVYPKMYDNKGTSLLLLNSAKGKELFDLISNNTICKEVDLDTAITFNSSAVKSAAMPKKRENFFTELNSISTEKLFNKYCKPTSKEKLRRLVGKLFRIMKLK